MFGALPGDVQMLFPAIMTASLLKINPFSICSSWAHEHNAHISTLEIWTSLLSYWVVLSTFGEAEIFSWKHYSLLFLFSPSLTQYLQIKPVWFLGCLAFMEPTQVQSLGTPFGPSNFSRTDPWAVRSLSTAWYGQNETKIDNSRGWRDSTTNRSFALYMANPYDH